MITNRKKVGTVLGFVALTAAVLTVAFWFHLANQVAIPEDRTLFVVAFLVLPVLALQPWSSARVGLVVYLQYWQLQQGGS